MKNLHRHDNYRGSRSYANCSAIIRAIYEKCEFFRRRQMNRTLLVVFGFLLFVVPGAVYGQAPGYLLSGLTKPHDYVLKRISSYDRTGGNDDYRPLAPGETLTLLDETGPGEISHVWITIASEEKFHLKKMVLRMYWDSESSPSVEAPVGDFFGLG